ncbi:MAG TPA: hypothetical protein VGW12_10925 [Pyrinomonadaceae bacterium]|nr:hypothetical protein [Pyrinomonadaceae bacterium]
MRETRPETEREWSDDDARWRGIYVAAIAFTVLVIVALWFFSRWFSS